MGSFSILNNIAGLNAQNQLNLNNVNLSRTLLRLSSGKRINSGADDAAGLQIADSLRANVRAMDQAVRNANDGISVAQVGDGALEEVTNLLTRAVQLAEEAATSTVDDNGRTALNDELTAIKDEITRIATQTNFNGVGLFTAAADGGLDGSLDVFVGDLANTTSTISVTIDTLATGGVITDADLDLSAVSLSAAADAQTAIGSIKTALDAVAQMRGTIGAGMNRLQSAVAVLQAQSQNTQAAESTIRDANVAAEISNLTKYQILSQSGIAALSQANASSQSVLSLLRQ